MRILVCGWVGSTNLGDELVLAGVRRLLGPEHVVAAISVDPASTRTVHGVAAIDHRRLDLITRAARGADLVILGGGGLIQDETSAANLPYHLSRVAAAQAAGTPWIGLGLGVGPLRTRPGRRLATFLRRAGAVTVRDAGSRALLEELGVPCELGADAAWHLMEASPVASSATVGPQPQVEAEGFEGYGGPIADERAPLVVSLRPWTVQRGRLPVGWRRTQPQPDWFVPTVAAALDRAAQRTARRVRFVALQTDRDAALHEQVAAAMRTPATTVVPTLASLRAELADAAAVVAMRYHAGIAATMAGVPSVLIGYSPKVDELARELGSGSRRLGFDRDELGGIDELVADLLGDSQAGAGVIAGRERLLARAAVDRAMVRRYLS